MRLAEGIVRHGTKKEVAANATAGFCFREVRGIAMQVQHHFRSNIADFGVGMSRQIVDQFVDILGGFIGGLGLMGRDCDDRRNNGSINGMAIV